MFSFFARKPAFSLSIVALVLSAGVVLAHRASGPSSRGRPLSLALSSKNKRVAPARWRDSFDPSRAKVEAGVLEQRTTDGTRIQLTLHPELQRRATALLARYEVPYGGIVAYNIESGELLVLAGRSQINPKLGPDQLCLTPWAPAASVFKIITASALLSRGVPASTSVCYHGGGHGLRNHHLREMPKIDTTCRTFADAIAKSINPIMGKLALRHLDRDLMLAWSERYGFNKAIPFELPVVPSGAEIPAQRLERARTAAGFWHTELSVLHGAVVAGVPASGGLLRWPHLVRSVTRPDGRKLHLGRAEPRRIMSRENARSLAAMMARTTSPIGTGRRGFIRRDGVTPYLSSFEVAGKTGSLGRRSPPLSYSWFVGFAPVQKPEVAFAVLLGNPPRWRIKASTAARMLLADYLELVKGRKTTRRARSRRRRAHKRRGHSKRARGRRPRRRHAQRSLRHSTRPPHR